MKFKARGRHLEIPIIGYQLAELRLAIERLVELRFRDAEDGECSLQLEESLTVTNDQNVTIMDGSRPGRSFAPAKLTALVEHLGRTVVDALAQEDGTLRIELSSEVHFSVTSTSGYEAWHLAFRRHGESWSGHLHGAAGKVWS